MNVASTTTSQHSQNRVDSVRNRLVFLRRFTGVMALLGAALLTLVILITVDSVLRFNVPARFLLLAVFLGLGAMFVRRWGIPAFHKISEFQASHAIERTHPQFRGRLVTAVELGPRAGLKEPGVSGAMLDEVIRQSEEVAGNVNVKVAAPVDPYRKTLVWSGLGIAVFIVWSLLLPGAISIGIPRIIAPWSMVSWPQKVRIFLSENNKTMVERGGTLQLEGRVEGEIPASGILRVRAPRDGAMTSRSRFEIAKDGRLFIRYRPVVTDIEVKIEAGDAATEYIPITMVPPPEIKSINLHCQYPAYTKLEPRDVPDGNVEALYETEVSVSIEATKALRDALISWEDGSTTPMEIQDASAARATYKVARTTTYQVLLTDTLGFTSDAPIKYRVEMNDNEYPRLEDIKPDKDKEITANAAIPLRVKASDDFALRSISVRYRVGDGVIGAASLPITQGSKQAETSLLWDLTSLGLKTGDVLEWKVEILDEGNHAEKRDPASSPQRKLTVIDPSTLVKKLNDRKEQILQRLTALEQIQRLCSDNVQRLQPRVTDSPDVGPLLEELQPNSVQQEQIRRNTALLAELLNEVIEDYEISKIGNEQQLSLLRETAYALEDLSIDLMPQATQRLERSVAALRSVLEEVR